MADSAAADVAAAAPVVAAAATMPRCFVPLFYKLVGSF